MSRLREVSSPTSPAQPFQGARDSTETDSSAPSVEARNRRRGHRAAAPSSSHAPHDRHPRSPRPRLYLARRDKRPPRQAPFHISADRRQDARRQGKHRPTLTADVLPGAETGRNCKTAQRTTRDLRGRPVRQTDGAPASPGRRQGQQVRCVVRFTYTGRSGRSHRATRPRGGVVGC